MAENIGDALLSLRTDDTQFDAGISRAEGKAQRLGTTLDKTSGSSTRLGNEMITTGGKAERMGSSFARGGQQVTTSAAAQKAGMQQLGYQIGDIATMYSLGARPSQIFASQISQVTGAIQLASGGASKFAAFLGGPWGIALTAATIVLSPWIASLFEGEKALEAAEFASDQFADAQSILGTVLDLTTGKLKDQTGATLALARAQLAQGRVAAMRDQMDARNQMIDIRKGNVQLEAGMMGGLRLVRQGDGTEDVVTRFMSGTNTGLQAEAQLRNRLDNESITPEAYLRAAEAITSFDMAAQNMEAFDDALKALTGDTEALQQFLKPTKDRPARTEREKKPEKDRTTEIAARFDTDMARAEMQELQAKLRLAQNAEDRADIQHEMLALEKAQRIAEIDASDYSADQKAALKKQLETLYGTMEVLDEQGNIIVTHNQSLEAQLIARERIETLEREAQALADQMYDATRDSLQLQFDLADTEAERKRIALDMLAAEEAYLRSRLQAVIDSEAANDAERMRAKLALEAMQATAAQRRESVARANETTVERYMRDLNKTPEQLNEAIDQIKIGGLEALNSELMNAIVNFRSIGDVARNMVRTVLADLLQLQIQQMLIKPLAKMLGLGGAANDNSADGLSQAGDKLAVAGGTLNSSAALWMTTAARIQAAAIALQTSGGAGGAGGGTGGTAGGIMSLISTGAQLFGGGGAGPSAGLVSSVSSMMSSPQFAGLFAEGGLIPQGQVGIVGEAGAEAVVSTPQGAMVVPNSALKQGGKGGGSLLAGLFGGAGMLLGGKGGGGLFKGLLGGAGMLLGGESGGGLLKGLFGGIGFAGLFADGGLIPSGQFGIVGEEGPEPVFATPNGIEVLPNSSLRGGGNRGGFGPQQPAGPMIGTLSVSVPARADPRVTASSVARGVQQGQARAARRGIAGPAGHVR